MSKLFCRFVESSKSYQVSKISSLEKSMRQRLTKQARLKRRTKSSDFDSSSCGYGKDEDSSWFDPGRQLEEKSDRISKEKQKFFRQSAFNKGSKDKFTADFSDESSDDNKPKIKEQAWGFAAAAAGGIATGPFSMSVRDNGSSSNSQPCTSSSDGFDKYKSGFGQLKGLFDGLSHLFTAPCHTRMRPGPFPNYSLTKRKTKNPDLKGAELLKEAESKNSSPMTPSRLFKTAVSSKQHEQERRRLLSGDLFSGGTRMEEIKMKKRHIIAEATATQRHRGTNSGKTILAWPRVRLCVWVAGWPKHFFSLTKAQPHYSHFAFL